MRSRILKPGFFSNEDLGECSPLTRILFEGLWCLADREGRLEYRPSRIRAEVFPYENITPDEIREMVADLQKFKFVQVYDVVDKTYLLLPEFLTHQKPHPREAQSTHPGPSKDTPRTRLGSAKDTPRRPVSISVSDPVFDPVSVFNADPVPEKRGSETTRVGDLVQNAIEAIGGRSNEALIEDICNATAEPWMAPWWTSVVNDLAGHDGCLGSIEERLHEIQDAQNPDIRQAKGIGTFERPGGAMVKRAHELCERAGVRWPRQPAKPKGQKQ